MKSRKELVRISFAAAAVMLAGCAQQQQRGTYHAVPAMAVVPQPQPPPPSPGYGPSYETFEENGVHWIRGSMAFPTGLRESSGVLVEKVVPAEVLAGQPFDYSYKVSNLTDYPIHMVTLADRVSPNFTAAEIDPKPSAVRDGVATWQLETLGPKETKTIRVRGTSAEEGAVNTCGWVSYSPLLCEDVRVVKAALQLLKTAPQEAIICDPIPMTLTVKNTGSSALTGVKVTDALPEGLVSDGKSTLDFEVGNLAPGESRDIKFDAAAAKTGEFVTKAQATSAQGVQGEASTKTIVHEPVLTVACTAPPQQYMGRSFEVLFTVGNKGDAEAAGTILEVPIPGGLSVKAASNGGQATENKISWDLGSVAVNAPQQVSATFVGATAGNFQFSPTAKGTCAKPVESSCQTLLMGVAGILLEKADDPDPVEVGETTTYTVKVTNQGNADDHNVQVVVIVAPELTPVSATEGAIIDGQRVTFPVVPRLGGKEAVTHRILVKGAKAGDGRTRFELNSELLKTPLIAEESTHVY